MKQITSVVLLVVFLSVLFVGLFNMSSGMDMSGGGTGCMFMAHSETICPMSIVDHLSTWQAVFISIAPELLTILGALAVAIALHNIPPHLLAQKVLFFIPILQRTFRERLYTFSCRALQAFFARGILHPKLF